ncbi:hypothetical protein PC9H_003889 [Pleurotus ostreatus]|uniref:G-patch domain-containing protein n=1 Tax=Pleurotus ostreatus TaxID=5322 RepID=A0A8H7A6N1_PLEOS|nr:uncharacterized protein PC9H_003889 [Pleurotus ostreatus]KAF7437055.1 hypothetical protein PC9H_003889 [Pleurotus ostreatus]KAJ8702897.1 hypothetical protein PTI98_001571 [Pleurotus ostreatus]
MSAKSVALWNALPMQPNEESHAILKRSRDDYEASHDDDDDDVSIASRTPSPSPGDAMDVDLASSYKYDEYVRGPAREVITVETKIKSTNKGFAMLASMGWTEGQPLGLSGEGRTEPIPFQVKNDSTGLGKINQDVRMIETTVSQRRGLDSERQHKESEEQRRIREEAVAKETARSVEISDTLKAFYCSLCDKQFKNVAQYDEHTNSYAHHHKARYRDMQANARIIPKEELDRRKEKERKREEKELRKMAAAIGIKMSKPAEGGLLAVPTPGDSISNGESSPSVPEQKPTGFKKSGWATVSSPAAPTSGFSRGSGNPPAEPAHLQQPSGSWTKVPAPPPQPSTYESPHFRTGGWSSLDPGPQNIPRPPPTTDDTPIPPQPQPPTSAPAAPTKDTRSSWQQFQKFGKARR